MSGYILDCPGLKYLNILNAISQQRQLSGDRREPWVIQLSNSLPARIRAASELLAPVANLKVGVDGSKPNFPAQALNLVLVVFKSVSSVYS